MLFSRPVVLPMFRICASLVAFALLASGCLRRTDAGEPLVFYVCTEGDDRNPGTFPLPFATPERARDAVRDARPSHGATIVLRGGDHLRQTPFRLDARDAGSFQAPVVYRAHPGETVRLVGGRRFRLADFEPVTDPAIRSRLPAEVADRVRQIDLAKHGVQEFGAIPLVGHAMYYITQQTAYQRGSQAPELFFEGEPMHLARWPNEGFATIDRVVEGGDVIRNWMDDRKTHRRYVPPDERSDPPKGFAFILDDDRVQRWQTADDLRLHGYWFNNYSDQTVEVAEVDPEQRIVRSVQPSAFGIRAGQRFYAYNLIEELDEPGEWYLDRSTGLLYILPPAGRAEATLTLSLLEQPLLLLEDVSHVHFVGIECIAGRAQGIAVQGGEGVRVESCRVGNTAGTGIHIEDGREHVVRNCEVFHVGGTGISASGGDAPSLTPAGHRVENNHIHHFARIRRTYQPGIFLAGVGQRAAHNEIHSAPHAAIIFRGNNHRIEYNHIHDVCRETDDMGTIYSGRSWTTRGTVIRANLIRGIHGYQGRRHRASGVYLDGGLCGTAVVHNLFVDIPQGVFVNGGRDNRVEGNLFLRLDNAMRATDQRVNFTTWAAAAWQSLNRSIEGVAIDREPWKSAYPTLATILEDEPKLPKYNIIRGNLVHAAPLVFGERGIHDGVVELGTVENNSELPQPPGTFDPETGRFVFDPESGVFDLLPAFKTIDPRTIGRQP